MTHLLSDQKRAGARSPRDEEELSPSPSRRWGVILAGGDGTRLRALTKRITGDDTPKQFCPLLGRETLLEQTRRRVAPAIPPEQSLVVVTRTHERFYSSHLADVPAEQILVQPTNQGTAPAILYSLLRLAGERLNDAVAFFPSDHYFSDEITFMDHVEAAFGAVAARPEMIVLLGMTPTEPETGYGWIEPDGPPPGRSPGAVSRVRRFWEKPRPALARSLLGRGCLWNSFVMVGRVSAFLEMTRRAVPDLYDAFAARRRTLGTRAEEGALRTLYRHVPPVNFSREVLAKRPGDLSVLRVGEVGWSDWGEPGRVLSTLAGLGVRTEWAASAG